MARHTGESPHSFEEAVKAAAKKVDKQASFKIVEQSGNISANPGTINKFVVIIDIDE